MPITLNLVIEADPVIQLESDLVIIDHQDEGEGDYSDDESDYFFVPSFSKTVLPTKGKRLKNDLTIEGIPCAEVENDGGGLTLSILS